MIYVDERVNNYVVHANHTMRLRKCCLNTPEIVPTVDILNRRLVTVKACYYNNNMLSILHDVSRACLTQFEDRITARTANWMLVTEAHLVQGPYKQNTTVTVEEGEVEGSGTALQVHLEAVVRRGGGGDAAQRAHQHAHRGHLILVAARHLHTHLRTYPPALTPFFRG
jgi:hypothetical protein